MLKTIFILYSKKMSIVCLRNYHNLFKNVESVLKIIKLLQKIKLLEGVHENVYAIKK